MLENYAKGGLNEIARVSIGKFYSTVDHVLQIDAIFGEMGRPVSKQKWLRIIQLIMHYHSKSISKI